MVEVIKHHKDKELEKAMLPNVKPVEYDFSSFIAGEKVWAEVKDILFTMRKDPAGKYFTSEDANRLRKAVELLRSRETADRHDAAKEK
jgi:hypothetical protein